MIISFLLMMLNRESRIVSTFYTQRNLDIYRKLHGSLRHFTQMSISWYKKNSKENQKMIQCLSITSEQKSEIFQLCC